MTKTITRNIENPDKADVWLDLDNPHRTTTGSFPNLQDMVNNQTHQAQDLMQEYSRQKRYLAEGAELKLVVTSSHLNQSHQQLIKNTQTFSQDLADIRSALIKAQTPSVFGLW